MTRHDVRDVIVWTGITLFCGAGILSWATTPGPRIPLALGAGIGICVVGRVSERLLAARFPPPEMPAVTDPDEGGDDGLAEEGEEEEDSP